MPEGVIKIAKGRLDLYGCHVIQIKGTNKTRILNFFTF